MNDKLLYEVDPHNRLVIKKTKRPSNVKRFRTVVEGRFKTDGKNRLYYELLKGPGSNSPQKIKFSGTYSLDKNSDLVFTMDKWNNQYAGNRLRLKAGVIGANDSELVFLLNSTAPDNKKSAYIMKLHGVWRADKKNRIGFEVEKEADNVDRLTFFNAWSLNKDNEIEYRCNRTDSSIALKGSWDIGGRDRIRYVLNKNIDSGFDFRVSFGRIAVRKDSILARFSVAVSISKKKRVKRDIVFSGAWRLSRDREFLLEISPGRKKNPVLKLKKELLGKDGVVFAESFIDGEERYIGGGIALRW